MRFNALFAFALLASAIAAPIGAAAEEAELTWQGWSALFAKAKAEQRFVILDLEAVWCHWCHVMEKTTYADAKVVTLLKSKYLPVRVDQDANPDLSSRYGDWGWPATIIFAPDGTEIVKCRGYLPPERMAALLQAVIEDPSPGPSVVEQAEITPAESPLLDKAQRAELLRRSDAGYDTVHGGFGPFQRFIDTDSMDLLLTAAEKGDPIAAKHARQTLDAALVLIDRELGGIYQYSDTLDWSSPHYEKIMWYQANGLRQCVQAYALWEDARYLAAAEDLKRFLLTKLRSAEGAFYTSQDADIDETMPGKSFYALSAEERTKLGREPRIDTHIYARENGWAIPGLLALYDATGDEPALRAAERAAQYILANRTIEGGGFSHGDHDQAGPLSRRHACHGAGCARPLCRDRRARVARHCRPRRRVHRSEVQGRAGRLSHHRDGGIEWRRVCQEREAVRRASCRNTARQQALPLSWQGDLSRARGARGALSRLARNSRSAAPASRHPAGDRELSEEPTHITVVGGKDEPQAASLHAAGLAFPALYKRIDWWDKREGPLPNPDVQYPELAPVGGLRLHESHLFAAGVRAGRLGRDRHPHAGGKRR